MAKQPTVSTDSVAQDQIRAFVERVERIEAEVKDLNKDKSEIFAEAKGNGFDVKVLKLVVARRRQNPEERMEREALIEIYEAALAGRNLDEEEVGTPRATRAPAHASRDQRRRQRFSESMDDHKALVDEMADAGLISEEAREENKRLSDALADKFGDGPLDPEPTPPHDPVTGEIIEDNEPASSEAQVRADRSEWPDRQNEPDHSPDAGKMVNEPATAPPTVGGPVEGVAPPASSATNFPVTVEGSSSTGGTDVGGDGEAHSMPDKSGEGDAPSPASGDGEPTNVVALPVRKPSDRPLSTSGLERPYGCLHVDACPKTWRDTEPCSMCRAAIAVEAGGTAVQHQGSIGQ